MGITRRTLKDGSAVYDVVEYTGFTADGKRGRESRTCRSMAEARAVQADMRSRREARRGRSGNVTFGAYAEGVWWPSLSGLAKSSRDTYEKELRLRLMPAFGGTELRDIGRASIQRMVSGCASESVARKAVSTLKTVLNEARADGLIEANPACAKFSMPAKGRKRDEGTFVTRFEDMAPFWRALEEYGDDEAAKLFYTGFLMGLRPEERYGLDWEDFAPDMGSVAVKRAYTAASRREGGPHVKAPKTALSARVLRVPARARYFFAGLERGRGPFVANRAGGRIAPSSAQKKCRAFYRWAEAHGRALPYVTLENMRHSYATSYLHAGGDVADLSRILGHSDINTTYRRYVRPSADDMERGILGVALG